ncbi:unnamed protein product, partial [Bubo scandiacus]
RLQGHNLPKLILQCKPDFKIMCISGGMSELMSVPLGSERREVTLEILWPQIFAGINVFNPQGQIKYEFKNEVQ